MNMIEVSSSDIYSVGYENGTLYICFNKGGIYAYYGVPQNVYLGLMQASSKGRFFHQNIKKNYKYEKLKDFSMF